MSNRFDFGGVNLRASEESAVARPTSETPFCIAILGDFSGRESRGLIEPKAVRERRPYLIDRDNFDEVLLKLRPELHLPTEHGTPLVFRFSQLDDFHPDRLFENEAFHKLKALRERVQDSSAFAEIAEELGLRASSTARDSESPRISAPSPARLASGSLLDEMIEQTESRVALEPAGKPGEIQEFARQLAAKYSVSAPDPRQGDVVAAVDGAIGDTMRVILQHPYFQTLEAIWRATFLLVRQIETGPQLKIYLIDISKHELAADLASDHLDKSGTFRLLVEKAIDTPGADPWAVVVGNFKFGSGREDMDLLAKLAAVAQRAGAAFVGEADPSLLGCSSLEAAPHPRDWSKSMSQDSWQRLRSRPESASLALALPRFLLRLPYGQETSPLESFAFEEFPGPPSHNGYLWGNSAFVVALLLGQSFSEAGWEMRPGTLSQIENLPLHTYRVEGDSQLKPCAEVLLTEEAVERILDCGLIPLVSYKGRDSVRVGRFQSIAEPNRPLAGRWQA
jgi:type VI secretion system protein ImpC